MAIGFVACVVFQILGYLRLKSTLSSEGTVPDDETRNILGEIERRLTDDVQDVMIGVSEKIGRMEFARGREKLD